MQLCSGTWKKSITKTSSPRRHAIDVERCFKIRATWRYTCWLTAAWNRSSKFYYFSATALLIKFKYFFLSLGVKRTDVGRLLLQSNVCNSITRKCTAFRMIGCPRLRDPLRILLTRIAVVSSKMCGGILAEILQTPAEEIHRWAIDSNH